LWQRPREKALRQVRSRARFSRAARCFAGKSGLPGLAPICHSEREIYVEKQIYVEK
jgi:hypothetical protein